MCVWSGQQMSEKRRLGLYNNNNNNNNNDFHKKKGVKSSVGGDEDIILLSAARARPRHKKKTPSLSSKLSKHLKTKKFIRLSSCIYLNFSSFPVNGKVVKGLPDRHKTHHCCVYRGTPCRCIIIYIIVSPPLNYYIIIITSYVRVRQTDCGYGGGMWPAATQRSVTHSETMILYTLGLVWCCGIIIIIVL